MIFTILEWPNDTESVNDLYQLTGTHTCRHTSLSLPLVQNSIVFFVAFCVFVAAASACTHVLTIAIITTVLASVPSRVLSSLLGHHSPTRAGFEKLAGGRDEESHLTRKQKPDNVRLLFYFYYYLSLHSRTRTTVDK